MPASNVSVLRPWRLVLWGLVVAGLLLAAPFTGDPGSQCHAKGKGGGHAAKGHKGHKARAKRHGPKRHHAAHHAAKKHRHANRRKPHSHKSHSGSSHVTHTGSTHDTHVDLSHKTHVHNAWDYYWGHSGYAAADGAEVVHDGAVAVNSVVKPVVKTLVKPVVLVEKYVYQNGSFARYLREGKPEWVESKTDGGAEFHFAETSSDKDWYRLFDAGRNMSLRLPVAGGMSFWSKDQGQTWKGLHKLEKVSVSGQGSQILSK